MSLDIVDGGERIIFVCSPYSGDIAYNTHMAVCYCQHVIAAGYIPFAPHLIYPQMLDENVREDRMKGIAMGLAMLGRCDELWYYGDPTPGMAIEIAAAHAAGKKVVRVL